MSQTTNQAGLQLIESFEGLRLNSYQDSVGVWTIGYGHTLGVKAGQAITQAQAEAFLQQDLGVAEAAVNKLGLTLTDNQFAALVSFTFKNRQKDQVTGQTSSFVSPGPQNIQITTIAARQSIS